MHPKADEFILDVRRAMRMEAKPTVTTDSQLIDPDSVARVLERATIWLTPKIVEVYDPAAFAAWPEDLQTELHVAVEGFRAVASTVPPDKPAAPPQAREGVQAFARLKEAVQKVALSEWLDRGHALINEVEAWAKEFGWVTRRQQKKMDELLLGEYALDQLYMHAEGNLYILDPVARFIPGGLGAFDLSIQPSFYVTSIYCHKDGTWYIHLDVGQGERGTRKERLSGHSLRGGVMELRSLL
jgi:hypothetical protein